MRWRVKGLKGTLHKLLLNRLLAVGKAQKERGSGAPPPPCSSVFGGLGYHVVITS